MQTVLCFGDSNTYGTKPISSFAAVARFGHRERWPGLLREHLGEGFSVVEEGLPGRTTTQPDPIEGAHMSGIDALPIVLGSHSPIDVMVIMLGTNDCKNRFGLSSPEIAWGLHTLALRVLRSDAGPGGLPPAILLVAPPQIHERGPLESTMLGAAARSLGLASEYRRVASDLGLGFFDAGSVANTDTVDGIHLDADGHMAIAEAIAQELGPLSTAPLDT